MLWLEHLVKNLLQNLNLVCGHNLEMDLRSPCFVFVELQEFWRLCYILGFGDLDFDCVCICVLFVKRIQLGLVAEVIFLV